MEWRSKRSDFDNYTNLKPSPDDFETIINDENAFCPSALHSVQYNSEQLSSHLRKILCLSMNDEQNTTQDKIQNDNKLLHNDDFSTWNSA
jgi:hypothetical protein